MRITLRAPIVLHCATPRGRSLALLSIRLLRATLISYFIFSAYTKPLLLHLAWFERVVEVTVRVLDLPVGLASRLLPQAIRPFSIWFDADIHYPFPTNWYNYLVVTIPVYLGLFYGFGALRGLWRRRTAT
jgi:hypothetical protein